MQAYEQELQKAMAVPLPDAGEFAWNGVVLSVVEYYDLRCSHVHLRSLVLLVANHIRVLLHR